jgi:hypothetical protein
MPVTPNKARPASSDRRVSIDAPALKTITEY